MRGCYNRRVSRPRSRAALTCRLLLLALLLLPAAAEAQEADWRTYLGDPGRRHYSPLDDITRDNVHRLQPAWRYDSGELRDGVSLMYTSPLIVDGVLYGLSPRLVAFALDAATGEELWRYDADLGQTDQRGLMWWESGADRRLLYTAGRHLIALDPANGNPVETFGDNGALDLLPDGLSGPFSVTVPGIVFRELIILGFTTSEDRNALPGSISAYRARDGALVWRFHSIPRPNDVAANTWAEGALASAGGANTWTGMALDVDRELLFAPTGSATPDFDGRTRQGSNLYANTLLALDVRTGSLRWHYQVVRHDLGDRDLPAPPTLVQLRRDGASIDAVAMPTKSGQLFVFDRDTGDPLVEVTEAEAAQSRILGEGVAPVQPQSAVAFTRQQFELTTRSQEAREFVGAIVSRLDQRPLAPPSIEGSLIYPFYAGGANWGGAAFDPSTQRLIINAQEIGGIAQIVRADEAEADYSLVDRNGIRDQDGLPGNTPPWGTLTSIDLATGRFDWQVPLGDYPSLAGAGYGAENYGGPTVSAGGLIFIAATPDAKLRAFDTRDGALLWQGDLPAGGFSTPAVYRAGGRQFVVIAAGGGRMGPPSSAEYVAFALPVRAFASRPRPWPLLPR
ncbi:MAG: PQQ-binding-like beta-propeller repeat protein [Acidobacteria bacterium]|nr:PQQ-binding-like beta-propeller repeat protein [Acidobacteriota bacterium]